MAFTDEVADGKGITGGRARREPLVCHVEEWEKFLFLDDIGDLLPLLRGRINTRWVVCTRMQKDDASFGSILKNLTIFPSVCVFILCLK